jgi:hypothetical protein
MGVNLDEAIYDANNVIVKGPNCNIGISDIDELNGKWFRDVFLGLNNSKTPWKGVNSLSLPYSSDFNIKDVGTYNFVNNIDNGNDYSKFRNYSFSNSTPDPLTFGQPDHSYYFYFGLKPGSTGLDKMNKKFFASCIQPRRDDIVIESNSTPDNLKDGNGCITFSFIGGVGPFNYTITGLNDLQGIPLNITPIVGSASTSNLDTKICKLYSGIYSIDATDSLGTIVSDTITVNGPIPLYCFANVSAMLSHDKTSDGAITLQNVGGGLGVLKYELKNSKGTIINFGNATTNLIINNLSGDSLGYSLTVYDESTPRQECITSDLVIIGPSVLNITAKVKNVHCFGEDDGEIKLNIAGGVEPYEIVISGPDNYSSYDEVSSGLKTGQYTINVLDSVASAKTLSVNVSLDNLELKIEKAPDEDVSKQCDPYNYYIPFDIISGPPNIQYSLNGGEGWASNPIIESSSNNRYVIKLSKDSVSADNGVIFRIWSDNIIRYDENNVRLPPCYSEEISYEVYEMALPPILTGTYIKDGLATNDSPLLELIYQNKKQCNADIATYKFSINQLDIGLTSRTPYTIDYHVETILNSTMKTLTHYSGLVTLTGVKNTNIKNGATDDYVDFYIRITDNKGCVFPTTGWYNPRIKLPTAALSYNISTNGTGPYSKKITVTGGIAPLKISNGTTITSGKEFTINNTSLIYVDAVTDANGCVLNIVG